MAPIEHLGPTLDETMEIMLRSTEKCDVVDQFLLEGHGSRTTVGVGPGILESHDGAPGSLLEGYSGARK